MHSVISDYRICGCESYLGEIQVYRIIPHRTCGGAAHKYCYHYKWDILSEELSTDLNNRAWGCTDSLDTCKKGCQDDQCTHFKCCYADVDFANNPALNWSDYEMCIYGRSEGSRAWGSWGLVGLVAGCHFISRTCLYQ